MPTETQRRCPDCGVAMERVTPVTSVDGEVLRLRTDEPKKGILGSLGLKETVQPYGYVCPECGLVRFYVDADGES
ncbi:hypothetical protein [Halegenticoccus soli]|uniref:hypothetical protein n=1 Tax=Halegenticoccus soli TaxID=1985678 RepID=UPI000C6D6568|nr:hypothetical protein [Halegenticoccus soli]